MMKKYELLEKAMRDYPAGTKAKFKGSGCIHTSDGIFQIHEDGYNGIVVLNSTGSECFYSENTYGEKSPQWAEIVQSNDISKVFNIGDHVYIKSTDAGCNLVEGRKGIIVSNDTIANRGVLEAEDYDYKIAIDREVWRVKGDFEPAKFVMRSEDGVDLYEGDNYHRAYAYENGVWRYDFCEKLALNHVVCNSAISSLAKAFSTKEAADKWIAEQNKTKSVQVPLFNTNMAMVSKDKIDIIDVIGGSISLKPSDLEDMLHAYKSLQ